MAAAMLMATGCTTLRTHKQRLKIATLPEGATILYQGQVLGISPCFIEVPRAQTAVLSIEKPGLKPYTLNLNTSYRWGDSFFSNMFLLYFAPIGWVTDLVTQTAWDYQQPKPILLPNPADPMALNYKYLEAHRYPQRLAIAPPQYSYEILSDELGEKLMERMRKRYPKSDVLDFAKTQDTFSEYDYTFDQKTPNSHRDDLFFDLGTTHVLESTAEKHEHFVEVKASVTDVFSDQGVQSFTEKFDASELKDWSAGTFKQAASYLLNLVPNTFTLDYDVPTTSLNIQSATGSQPFNGSSSNGNSIFNYISALGVRSSRSPQLVTTLQPFFHIVPLLSFSYNEFRFETSGPNSLSGDSFDWFSLLLGAGAEAGLDAPFGTFYGDFIPSLGNDWITGSGANGEASSRFSQLTLVIEFGYQIFVSQRINIRLFARQVTVPAAPWDQILTQLAGQPVSVNSATRGLGGISIGYYFPEDRDKVKHWLF